ncbi:MAG: type II secretion system protein, partial [Acidimicrobiales bacterium]
MRAEIQPRRARRFLSNGSFGRSDKSPRRPKGHADEGFTLIELLIVCVVTPIIIGSLAAGLVAVLSLQQGVSSRLSNSADSQMVEASYRSDIQAAQQITTASDTGTDVITPECGTGYQVLGLEWNFNPTTHLYQTVVSYVSVPVTNGTTTTYSLVRQECTSVESSASPIEPVNITTTISTNTSQIVQGNPFAPAITPTNSAVSTAWVPATGVTSVTFPITEPQTGGTNYQYTLVASPPTSASSIDNGGPITSTTNAGCGYAAPGTGTYASSLCLVDFSALSGNNMVAARQGCVELSVPLPGGSTMYFCIGITGAPVAPYKLPTWTDGFLGNSINGVPFYS